MSSVADVAIVAVVAAEMEKAGLKDAFPNLKMIGNEEKIALDSSMRVKHAKENAEKFGKEEEIVHYKIVSNKGYATSEGVRVNSDGSPYLITDRKGKQTEVRVHLETYKLFAKTGDLIVLKYNIGTGEIWVTFTTRMQDNVPSSYGLQMFHGGFAEVKKNTSTTGNAFTGETGAEAAFREGEEEGAGKVLKIGDKLDEFKFYNDDGGRDPRQPSITVASCTVLCATTKIEFEETDEAKGTQSFSEEELKAFKSDELQNGIKRFAFDHIDLALKAIAEFRLRLKARKYEEMEAKLAACIAELVALKK
jgi:hypothetical protein